MRIYSFFVTTVLFVLYSLNVQHAFAQNEFWRWGGLGPGHITPATNGRVFVSQYMNGLVVTTDLGNSWKNLGLANLDLRQVCVSPTNGSIFVATAGDSGGVFRSTDNGNSWVRVVNGMGSTLTPTRAIAVNSLGHLFAGTWLDGVYKSENDGGSWSPVLPAFDVFDLLVVPGKVFVGCAQGIYSSTDNGGTWTLDNSGVIQGTITSFAMNPSGHIFAATYNVGHIYRSTNNGTSWTRANTAIQAHNIQDIVFNPSNGIGFAATDSGIYRSTDNFASWVPLDSDVRRVYSYPQQLGMTQTGYVFASFVSGALLRSDISTQVSEKPSLQPIAFSLRQNFPNPFNPSTTIEYELPRRADVTINIYNSIGQLVRTLVSGETKEPGAYSVTWDGSDNRGSRVSSGAYFYTLRSGEYVSTKKSILLK